MTNGIYFQIRFRQWFWSRYWGLRWFELNRLTNGDWWDGVSVVRQW
jgi:hypothetical protein